MFAHPLLPGIAELQISHSEKFDISLGQKGLAWMSQLTLYNASRSYGRSIYGRPDRGCGRSPSRSVIAGRSALAWLSACSRSALLRLVLRTQPRAGIQISHSEKFAISLAQKRLAWMSQLTLYNAS